jgi:hypothetical protein
MARYFVAAGFGVDSHAVVSPCEKGTYSEGGGLTPCKKCPAGFTTEAPGAGKAPSDCLPAAGYDKDGTLCPISKQTPDCTCTPA